MKNELLYYDFEKKLEMERTIEQIYGMKWVAYAKAHVEGYDYYFSYDFNIPEELFNYLWNLADHHKPISKCERYEEVLNYAQIAIDYRKLCNFDSVFYEKEESESDSDYWVYLIEHNKTRKKVNADLHYIRLFDPILEEDFFDFCLSLPLEKNHMGEKKQYYFMYKDGEEYDWTISYLNDDQTVSKIISTVSPKDYAVFLSGNNSLYPPYEEILEALKNNKVYFEYKNG